MERPVHVWLVMGVRSSQEDTEYSRHGIVHLSKLSSRRLLWDTICSLSYLLGYDNHCDWHVLCQRRVSNFRITTCKKTCVQTPFCIDMHLYSKMWCGEIQNIMKFTASSSVYSQSEPFRPGSSSFIPMSYGNRSVLHLMLVLHSSLCSLSRW